MDKAIDQLRFEGSGLRYLSSEHHANQAFEYMKMNLNLQQDFVNNMFLEKNDVLIIVLESGNLILFSLSRNRTISLVKTDTWVSSVYLSQPYIWSVGKNREVVMHHSIQKKKMFRLQENKNMEGYYESGVVFQQTKAM